MSDEESKGRRFCSGPDGKTRVEGEADPAGADRLSDRALQEMTFSTHVVSLNAMAMMHMGQLGELPDVPQDLDAAAHVVDTLFMLRVKTQGNLTPEESRLLDTVLHDLRLKFVQLR
jgi:hypothetical protein